MNVEIEQICRILKKSNRGVEVDEAKPDLDLFAAGILDSIQVLAFIELLEEELSLSFDPVEITAENFRSLTAIQCALRRY